MQFVNGFSTDVTVTVLSLNLFISYILCLAIYRLYLETYTDFSDVPTSLIRTPV